MHGLRCMERIEDGEKSIVGFVKHYCEKLQTSMKLSLKVLRISGQDNERVWGRGTHFVEHSKTLIAFLHAHSCKRDSEGQAMPWLEVQRIQKMNAVHYNIGAVMKPVDGTEYKELNVRTKMKN